MKRKKIASTILAALLTASTLTTTVSAAPINDTQNVIVESQGENDFVEEAATKKVGTVTNCSQLNLRAQSNANSKILAVLKKGQQVDVLDQLSNGWVKVKYNGKTGYVSGKYLTIKKVNTSDKVTIKDVSKKGTVYNCTSLTVRSTYNANGKALGYLKSGASVTITGEVSNGWYRIKYNGKTGYVSGKYVKIGNVVKPPVNTISAARKKVLERAKEMVEVKWTSPITFLGWRAKASYTIKKGSTNTGIPYSQTYNQVRSGKEFKNVLSKMPYSYKQKMENKYITMPKYGNDCSGFVSAALGIERKTTRSLPNCTKQISYNDLKPGDIINKAGSHVILFAGWADALKTKMNVYEQTPPKCIFHTVNRSSYEGKGYVARRLPGLDK